jgi:hypothetical protein
MPTPRTSLLIVRAWVEPGSAAPLRARIQVAEDISDGFRNLVLSQSDEVERLVAQWLQDILGPHRPGSAGSQVHAE